MCHKPLLLWCLAVLAVSALAAGPLQAQKEELRAACQRAGFTAGGAKAGAGILIDCIAPIIDNGELGLLLGFFETAFNGVCP
jgi:hypothetical protein